MASEARQYAARNRQGSDWFSHSPTSPSSQPAAAAVHTGNSEPQTTPVIQQETPPPKSDDRTQLIKPKSDSNSWYKYEQGELKREEPPQAPAVTVAPVQSVPEISKAETEAAGNQQRSKAGMASDWFSHDHTEENSVDAVRQHGASKELGANAARMRGESEHWFSHDQGAENHNVVSPGAKGRPNRQGSASSNMQGIFNHGN